MDGKRSFKFKIHRVSNGTFVATLVGNGNNTLHTIFESHRKYDDTGALYYVVAVVFIYGCSIILMIASLIKKSKSDNGVSKYMQDMDKVRRLERRQQKFKTRMAMQHKGKVKPGKAIYMSRYAQQKEVFVWDPPGWATPETASKTSNSSTDNEEQRLPLLVTPTFDAGSPGGEQGEGNQRERGIVMDILSSNVGNDIEPEYSDTSFSSRSIPEQVTVYIGSEPKDYQMPTTTAGKLDTVQEEDENCS